MVLKLKESVYVTNSALLPFTHLGVLKECVVPIVCKEQVNALYDCGKKLAEPITEERIARECSKEVAHLW